jgi:hypothetical protein
MNNFLNRHTEYSILIKLSVILSEAIFICLFYFFPKLTPLTIKKINEPIILIDEIPITVQPPFESTQKPIPPQILFSDIIEEVEILPDILIIENSKSEHVAEIEYSLISAPLSSLTQSPRQILEVLPEQNRIKIAGSIRLSLKINKTGKVIDHKILYNNLSCDSCLSEILAAAYKSKWQTIINVGKNAEYWVEKTYSFY